MRHLALSTRSDHFRQLRPGERTAGFTLLEVQMTIVILLVGVMALSGTMVLSSHSQRASRERAAVSRALAAQMETIGETAIDLIPLLFNGQEFDIPGVTPATAGRKAGQVTVTIVNLDYLEVTVTATWRGDAGTESHNFFQEFAR